MFKKFVAGIAGLAIAGLFAVPASAGVFGDLETLNPNGGTSASNGIKIDYAAGSLQVTRNGLQQIYPAQSDVDEDPEVYCETGVFPNPDVLNCVSSAFIVTASSSSYDDDFTIGAPDPWMDLPADPWDLNWSTVTSNSVVDEDGSGTIYTVLTYEDFDYCQEGCTSDIVLLVEIDYTYPNQYLTVTTNVEFVLDEADVAFYNEDWELRTYYYEDATLSGLDEGNQFEGTDANGNVFAGVIRPDGAAIEGVRAIADNDIFYYVGDYTCPIEYEIDYCPDVDGGWTYYGTDLPNVVDPAEDVDNGFAVQSGPAIELADIRNEQSAGVSYDLLFMACDAGTTDPEECIAAGGAVPDLAATGTDVVTPVSAAVALFAIGALAVVLRRRTNRSTI